LPPPWAVVPNLGTQREQLSNIRQQQQRGVLSHRSGGSSSLPLSIKLHMETQRECLQNPSISPCSLCLCGEIVFQCCPIGIRMPSRSAKL
jgi:hypothetical protein